MPLCTSEKMFKPLPMVYDKDDEDLYHDFRKCVFVGKIKGGIYKFKSSKSEDYMIYEIGKRGNYKRSHGLVNGSRITMHI